MSKKIVTKKRKANNDATRFAHLINARAQDPEQDDPNAEEEDQENSAEEDQDAEDPEEQNGRAKGKKTKAKKAKAEEDDADAEEDGDIDAEDQGDDETDAEDEDDDTTAQARVRERGRCTAIFSCKAAANNLALAAELAFGTNIPRSQAIRILKAGGVPKAASSNKPSRTLTYDQRMMRSRQALSVDAPKRSQHISKTAMQATRILQSAQGTGIVKKEHQ